MLDNVFSVEKEILQQVTKTNELLDLGNKEAENAANAKELSENEYKKPVTPGKVSKVSKEPSKAAPEETGGFLKKLGDFGLEVAGLGKLFGTFGKVIGISTSLLGKFGLKIGAALAAIGIGIEGGHLLDTHWKKIRVEY